MPQGRPRRNRPPGCGKTARRTPRGGAAKPRGTVPGGKIGTRPTCGNARARQLREPRLRRPERRTRVRLCRGVHRLGDGPERAV
nr:MAG TPA: hypothetical protein [Caudoviricetes sp.]